MTAKEYLGQAYRVDLRIRCKMEQVQSLRELAVKASSTLSDMPKGSGYTSKADIVAKIVDYENEINKEIRKLVKLKEDVTDAINSIPNAEQRTLLELRYLMFNKWEEIAIAMGYGIDNVYKIHKRALKNISKIKSLQ